MRSLALAALAVALIPIGCDESTDVGDQRQALIDGWTTALIVPGYAAFADATRDLQAAAESACAADDPDADAIAATQSAWHTARRRLKAMDVFTFGPWLAYPDRPGPHIDFWPVRTERLATRLTRPPTVESMDRVSATERGLPAVEYILFGTDLPWPGDRCQYLVAAATDLAGMADGLARAWDPAGENYAAALLTPDGGPHTSLEEAFSLLVNRMGDQVLLIRHDKLGRPLGDSAGGTPQPQIVESPASGRSLQDIRDAMATIRLMYDGGDGFAGLATHRQIANRPGLHAAIDAAFDQALAALDAIDRPLAEAVVETPATVRAAIDAFRALQTVLQVDMQGALGVSLAFGSGDGD